MKVGNVVETLVDGDSSAGDEYPVGYDSWLCVPDAEEMT